MKKTMSKILISLLCIFSLSAKTVEAGPMIAAPSFIEIAIIGVTIVGGAVILGASASYKAYNHVKSDLNKPLWRCDSSKHVRPVYFRSSNKPVEKNYINCVREK